MESTYTFLTCKCSSFTHTLGMRVPILGPSSLLPQGTVYLPPFPVLAHPYPVPRIWGLGVPAMYSVGFLFLPSLFLAGTLMCSKDSFALVPVARYGMGPCR